ncbi:MAG: PleD family two-component system response regulator [Mangrovibacterium sp.]
MRVYKRSTTYPDLMKTILLVDDKVQLLTLLKQFLKTRYEVVLKYNGLEAIEWIQQGNIPDLILTDIQMPKMDGLKFLQIIKGSGIFSEIPVIILSSRESSQDRIECLKQGASDYISKPFNPEELLVRIERWMERS